MKKMLILLTKMEMETKNETNNGLDVLYGGLLSCFGCRCATDPAGSESVLF